EHLDKVYTLAQLLHRPMVMIAVVCMITKMCTDPILRNWWFERGMVDKICPLLNHPSTRCLALHLLLIIIHLANQSHMSILETVARLNPTLVKLVHDVRDDRVVTELAMAIMSHTIICTSPGEYTTISPANPPAEIYGIRALLEVTISQLRQPATCSPALMMHAFTLLVLPSQDYPHEYRHVTTAPIQALLVASLRSRYLITRVIAMDALVNLCSVDAERDPPSYSLDFQHIRRILTSASPLPSYLSSVTIDRCNSTKVYQSVAGFVEVMSSFARDHNFHDHGREVAEIVQRSPATPEGEWRELEIREQIPESRRLSFHQWSDVLLAFASALRNTGSSHDLDSADILNMKFLMIRGRTEEAAALGRQAIKRNPALTYAYYIVSLTSDRQSGYEAAIRGLECSDSTTFLRAQLLWRAVEAGVGRALDILEGAARGTSTTGTDLEAALLSALQHADMFTDENTLDDALMATMLGWRIIITIMLKGDNLDACLDTLKPTFQMVAEATEAMAFFGHPDKKSAISVAWKLIAQSARTAGEEWYSLVQIYDELDVSRLECPNGQGMGHELLQWFGRIECKKHIPRTKSRMRRCTSCGSANAILKRCTGCMIAKYCNAECQKRDWTRHRTECKGR
ncbi:hypothetical protein C8Q76DRAFT_632141, partial [Earliella scabrosa]